MTDVCLLLLFHHSLTHKPSVGTLSTLLWSARRTRQSPAPFAPPPAPGVVPHLPRAIVSQFAAIVQPLKNKNRPHASIPKKGSNTWPVVTVHNELFHERLINPFSLHWSRGFSAQQDSLRHQSVPLRQSVSRLQIGAPRTHRPRCGRVFAFTERSPNDLWGAVKSSKRTTGISPEEWRVPKTPHALHSSTGFSATSERSSLSERSPSSDQGATDSPSPVWPCLRLSERSPDRVARPDALGWAWSAGFGPPAGWLGGRV